MRQIFQIFSKLISLALAGRFNGPLIICILVLPTEFNLYKELLPTSRAEWNWDLMLLSMDANQMKC